MTPPIYPLASEARPELYHDRPLAPAEIAERVRRDGVIVFPGSLPPAGLAAANAEFDQIMQAPDQHGHKVDRADGMLNVRTTPATLEAQGCVACARLFDHDLIAPVSTAYFQTDDVVINRELFVNRNRHASQPVMRPPFSLHFDKREVFKFFYYLTDTGLENGGMRVAPGSVERNRQARRAQMEAGRPLAQIDNVIDERVEPPSIIDGPAGTLFVFTTDVSHGASFVHPRQERRIIRSHCYSSALLREMGLASAAA